MQRRCGPYLLEERIAQGGMGEVFRAVFAGPNGFRRTVAVKQMFQHLGNEPGFVEMFTREARIAAELSHPNVCQILELGLDEGRHYIAMEYLDGHSLARIAARANAKGATLPPAWACHVVARAADGLGYAHEKRTPDGAPMGIVHRDVSPENIVVTFEGQVKVVDFGIARAVGMSRHTTTGTVRGKVAYMSPEQLQALELDARSDIFSLGIVLYELLAGRPLFKTASDFQTMSNVMQAAIVPPAGLPPALEDVLARALERSLPARLSSARELAAKLDDVALSLGPRLDAPAVGAFVRALFEGADPAEQVKEATVATTPERKRTRAVAPPQGRSFAAPVIAGLLVLASGAVAWWTLRPVSIGAPVAAAPPAVVQPAPPPEPVGEREKQPEPPAPAPAAAPPPARPAPVRSSPRVAAARKAQPPEPAPVREVEGSGRLTVDVVPWADVFLGSRKLGTTPLVEVVVPAGRQRLHMVNAAAGIDRWVEVDISANQVTVQRYVF